MLTSHPASRAALRRLASCVLLAPALAFAAPAPSSPYSVLDPIVRGNLAIYPVVAAHPAAAVRLLTLDEGVRAGSVVVTEAGQQQPLLRLGQSLPPRSQGAEVNRLVLYNNSDRPLLLLAGEIVTGGKQDRVIGADRIVPAHTGPIDLGVFCVEPGRWVAASDRFGSMSAQMAQPAVRAPAMAEQDQNRVWDNVRSSKAKLAARMAAPEASAVQSTTSYAKAFASASAAKVASTYGGIENEASVLHQLRQRNAVGVVVAVGGRILWADVFASPDLLEQYWPKLIRSYVAEAMTSPTGSAAPTAALAAQFVDALEGGREVAETQAGVYRRTEITSDDYRVFLLTSLLSNPAYVVHIAKLADNKLID